MRLMYDIVQTQHSCQIYESLSQTTVQFRVRRNTAVAESLFMTRKAIRQHF